MDHRVRYTKFIIRKAFFQLLEEKPLNRITVRAICELAQINRSTFYRHYADPYDLLAKLEEELLYSLQTYLKDVHGIEQGMETMMRAIRMDQEVYTLLISDHGDPAFLHRLVFYSYDFLEPCWDSRLGHLPKHQRRWSFLFLAQGCIQVLLQWISDGCREEPEELSGFLTRVETVMLDHL